MTFISYTFLRCCMAVVFILFKQDKNILGHVVHKN